MIKNNIYTQILQDVFEKGEYCIIDDIVEYSEKVKLRLEEHYKNSIKNSSLDDLYKISYSITELIEDFKLNYLDDIKVQVLTIITNKEQNLINYYKKELEHTDKLKFLHKLYLRVFNKMVYNKYTFLEDCLIDVKVKLTQKQKEAENEERKRNREIAEQEQKHNEEQAERHAILRKANEELLIKQNEEIRKMKEIEKQKLEELERKEQEKKNKHEERRKIYNNFCCGVNVICTCENPNLRIVYDKAHCNICLRWRCRHSFDVLTL